MIGPPEKRRPAISSSRLPFLIFERSPVDSFFSQQCVLIQASNGFLHGLGYLLCRHTTDQLMGFFSEEWKGHADTLSAFIDRYTNSLPE